MLGIALVVLADAGRTDAIDDLQPGHWYAVPASRIDTVLPNPIPPGDSRPGRPESIVDEWSSGIFDASRNNFVVWGGGHNNYSGNEIYAFNLGTLIWQRITNPSTNVGGTESTGYYPDGRPRSRHTYDYIEYIPSIDRFCSFGGAGQYPSGQSTNEVANVDCFNFSTNSWETTYKRIPKSQWESVINGLSAYDPTGKRLYLHTSWIGENPGLYRWTPATDGTDAWELLNRGQWIGADEYMTAEIDPNLNVMVALGSGRFLVWDLNNPAAGFSSPTVTGDTSIRSAAAPGLAYDSASKRLVAWRGGADVFVLSRSGSTWNIERRTPATTNAVTPTTQVSVGTYGRFRYVPSRNAFVAVNSIHENVYIYKLSAGGGSPGTPTLQFSGANFSVGEGAGSVIISVTRTGSSSGAVSVNYATANGTASAGSDYTLASGVLSWADGESGSKSFSIPIINDTDQEADETVVLALSNPTNGAILGPQATATLTITDNDGPSTLQFAAATYSVNESAGSASITVTRGGNAAGAVSVNYTTVGGSASSGGDFTAASGVLTWANGVTGSRTIAVPVVNDSDVEGNETFTLTLSNPTGAVLGGNTVATVTIVDDDSASTPPPPPTPPPSADVTSSILTGGTKAGGCVLATAANRSVDPVLPALVILSLLYLLRRSLRDTRKQCVA
jgi:hypothetical protein